MRIQTCRTRIKFVGPDFVKNRGARQDLSVVDEEQAEKVKFFAAEAEFFVLIKYAVLGVVERDGLFGINIVDKRFGLAAADGIDAGDQFSGLERFDNIIVGTGVKAGYAVFRAVFCGDEDFESSRRILQISMPLISGSIQSSIITS